MKGKAFNHLSEKEADWVWGTFFFFRKDVIHQLGDKLPDVGHILSSLNDIERSDKTRELLSEHDHPELRKIICAMFHSESRGELVDSLQIAGFDQPVRAMGLALGALLIDADDEDERIEIAIQEMRRTGAFDRSLIIAASPAGTATSSSG